MQEFNYYLYFSCSLFHSKDGQIFLKCINVRNQPHLEIIFLTLVNHTYTVKSHVGMRQTPMLTTVAQNQTPWEQKFSTPTLFGSRHRCPHRNFAKLFVQCIKSFLKQELYISIVNIITFSLIGQYKLKLPLKVLQVFCRSMEPSSQ